ncbi:MAG TPA: MASE1 domain-containing protein [Burkholderiaceae bacterium]|nr:MASE1 domain-containing protein [Burkholderiaceae bacterium]
METGEHDSVSSESKNLTPSGGTHSQYLAAMAIVAVAYFVAAKFGLSLAFSTKQVTALWPPTGIALAAFLLYGIRIWPSIFLAAFAINSLIGGSLIVAAGIAVGNTLAPIAAFFMLQQVKTFDRAITKTSDVLAILLFGAVLGMAVSATNGVANLALAGIIPWSAYASVWWVWWVGDGMGVLVFAPLILSWTAQPIPRWSHKQIIELFAIFFGLLISSLVALDGAFLHSSTPFQLQYAVFPFIIWVGLRFGIRETTLAILLVIGFAVWGAIHDRGPFVTGNLDERLILLEMFMAVVTVTGLVLSAANSERSRAQHALQQANDELEDRVQKRTAELADTNHVLAQKNEEVEAFVYIVSHDLRAPLVNLQGFSKELELGCAELTKELDLLQLPESNKNKISKILSNGIVDSLKFISASSTKFQKLIDALLMLSRTGKNEYRTEKLDVQALVDTTIASLRQNAIDSGTVITVGKLPPAMGDLTAIGQVFSNLISNAMKYLQPGRPGEIAVGGELKSGMVDFWIRDNGAGIPLSSQRRLFQVFQRFHPNLATGEGMGLAIVKRIVDRHGGTIRAESEDGVGTTFYFTLPAVDGG